MRSRQCHPEFWGYFSLKKTSKTSKFRDLLIYRFVSLSVSAPTTNHDIVERVAKDAGIPIDSLADDLKLPVYTRGRPIFGFVGDIFDETADKYDNMQWWISDEGLRFSVATPPVPVRALTFDERMRAIGSPRPSASDRLLAPTVWPNQAPGSAA
jgi:hypothetical protein